MDLFLAFSSFLISIVGIIGCILPALPGPPLAYAGVLLLHFSDKIEFTTTQLISWLLLVIVLQAIDYITPLLGNKYSGGTSAGNRGCIAGSILGLFFLPWGIILGPFLGAVVGELIGGKDMSRALRSGFGSLLGFIFGTLLKIVCCCYLLYHSITAYFG